MNKLDLTAVIILFGGAFVASLAGVAAFRTWSLRRNLLDIPNDRSSHSVPTPRGGGVVIVVVSLLGYGIAGAWLATPFSWGYFAGAILVAAISWLDDLYSLPFWSRLLVHIVAASVVIADLGAWSEIFVPLAELEIPLISVFGAVVTVLWIVWLVNAYNFMDGIDGIAALQAVVAGAAWAALGSAFGEPVSLVYGAILSLACLGFLLHNWQPARIFMGDVGSAFIGFTLAALPLLAREGGQIEPRILPVVAILFVWFFVFDTLITLFRRAFKRQKIWEAHREHIYQRMVIRGSRHARVTLLYGGFAALLASMVVLALLYSGAFSVLVFLVWVGPTVLLVYLGVRKSVDANN